MQRVDNIQSEVIRAGLWASEEREMAAEVREFDQLFAGGRAGEPAAKVLQRTMARQKAHRKGHR
jgi:hypothetical protein